MKLALFDLDHTLLPIDSADGWSHYLIKAAGLDEPYFAAEIRRHAADYRAGSFDVEAYLAFQMQLLARFRYAQLVAWRDAYLDQQVRPYVLPSALALIQQHQQQGFVVAIVTGTHQFVTRPIADAFGVSHLLAVQPEMHHGEFTGRYVGTHTYGEGKVRAVEQFLAKQGQTLATCEDSVFYSDSINDLPLLQQVRRPIATNADSQLKAIASQRGWVTLALFN